MPHPYRRTRVRRQVMPEVGISESGSIRSLHLGTNTIQSSMNVDNPTQLVLSYSRAMMAWLLLTDTLPQHITQIGLGGGSFARWLDEYLPDARQTAVEINPRVIQIARALFALPMEGEHFEVVQADGAEYIKTVCGGTDLILTDGFDGEQIVDAFVEQAFFEHCRRALRPNGVLAHNWWQGDKRYPQFLARLQDVFEGRVWVVPAESHGNIAVFAFQNTPPILRFDVLKKRASELSERYDLDFRRMLADAKAHNPHNDKGFVFLNDFKQENA